MAFRPTAARALVAFAVLSLVWGTTWAAIRVSLRGFPPFLGISLRFAIAAVVLLAVARTMGIRLGRERRERWLWVANGILAFSGSYGIVYWSEQHVPSGLASLLFATFPLLTVVLAHFSLARERMNVRSAVGVLVGLGGLGVIYSQDLTALGGPMVALASVVMLGSPVLSAVSNVLLKRFGEGIHPISLAAVPMGISAVLMALAAAIFEREAPVRWELAPLGAVIYLGLAGSALTFTIYYWLLANSTAVKASLIAYTTPIVAVAFGVTVMGEPLTTEMVVGGLLVLVGVAGTTWPSRRPRHRSVSSETDELFAQETTGVRSRR